MQTDRQINDQTEGQTDIRTCRWRDKFTDRRKYMQMDRQTGGRTDGYKYVPTDGQIKGQTEGQSDGETEGPTDGHKDVQKEG